MAASAAAAAPAEVPGAPVARTAERLADALLLAAVFALPFTQALTLNVRFPLKAYELLVPLVVCLRLLAGRVPAANRYVQAAALCACAFLAATLVSLFAVTLASDRPPDRGLYRFGPALDGLLQSAYLALALVTMLLVADLARRRLSSLLRAWLAGAAVAAGYGIYLNLRGASGIEALPLLPGTSLQIANLGPVPVFRAGTFLEGNFVGLYLLISLLLALLVGRRLLAVWLSVGLLLSLSTLSIAGMALLWAVASARDLSRRTTARRALLAAAGAVVVLAMLPSTFYTQVVVEKLRDPSSQSAIERRATALAGLQMFEDNWATGVGISQYGLWFPSYRPSFVPQEFLSRQTRYIPNNVYVQVAAEQGLLGLVPFLLLLASIVRAAVRHGSLLLITGVGTVLLCLNAFPSLTVVFVWAFFGLLAGSAGRVRWRVGGGMVEGRAAGGGSPAAPSD